jgi:hypothetical protein
MIENIEPYLIQYLVRQRRASSHPYSEFDGIATIIVFAEARQIAFSRAVRFLACNGLEINNFVRIHKIRRSELSGLDPRFQSVYAKAEYFGVGLHCEFFSAVSPYGDGSDKSA